MAIEEPQYSVIEKSDLFELRAYAPFILAEVQVEGDLDSASSQGFRLIAAYIFGTFRYLVDKTSVIDTRRNQALLVVSS